MHTRTLAGAGAQEPAARRRCAVRLGITDTYPNYPARFTWKTYIETRTLAGAAAAGRRMPRAGCRHVTDGAGCCRQQAVCVCVRARVRAHVSVRVCVRACVCVGALARVRLCVQRVIMY